jgi:hypothetical protein
MITDHIDLDAWEAEGLNAFLIDEFGEGRRESAALFLRLDKRGGYSAVAGADVTTVLGARAVLDSMRANEALYPGRRCLVLLRTWSQMVAWAFMDAAKTVPLHTLVVSLDRVSPTPFVEPPTPSPHG